MLWKGGRICISVRVRRKNEVKKTCAMEKSTKRRLMDLQQITATGIFSASMPTKVGNENPTSEVIRSMRMASPVKPLDRRFAGFTKARMVKACSSADRKTELAVIRLRTSAIRRRRRSFSNSSPRLGRCERPSLPAFFFFEVDVSFESLSVCMYALSSAKPSLLPGYSATKL